MEENPVILDLMAGWDSHIPDSLKPERLVALGLNKRELEANKAVTEAVIHDLNENPALPFPDNTFDAVICSVSVDYITKPVEVFKEVQRILKPGGRYIFLEHVSGLPGTRLRLLQDLLHRPWHWLFDGCNLNRDTHAIILQAGFSVVDVNCFMLNSSLVPVTPHIFGMALK